MPNPIIRRELERGMAPVDIARLAGVSRHAVYDAAKRLGISYSRRVSSRSERFWSHVDRSGGPDACWPWTGMLSRRGYGRFYWTTIGGNVTVQAHRFAWEDTNGPIPAGMLVCHHCDNRPCCNPSHHFLGTHTDNIADRHQKGRSASGERNGAAKLTWAQARAIRASTEPTRVLIDRYGIDKSIINDIRAGRLWREAS